MNKTVLGLFAGASLAMLVGLAGCADRVHLTAGYGRSYRAAFDQQPANPQAGAKARPLPGLDAQEASAVSRNYRRSLVARETQTTDQGMLILTPPQQGAQPYLPPPSVPQERP